MDIEPDFPGTQEDVLQCNSFSFLDSHSGEFRDIRFYPKSGGQWIGRFEYGAKGAFESSACSTPRNDEACVVLGGAGYWVNVESRTVALLRYLPITQLLISTEHRFVLIATFRNIYAHRSVDCTWNIEGLFQDRLRAALADKDRLQVVGFFEGEEKSVHIDIATGRVIPG